MSIRYASCLLTSTAFVLVPSLLVSTPASAKPRAGISDQFNRYAAGSAWTDGQAFGPWTVAFAGYGSVSIPSKSLLRLSPAAPTASTETHSALVVSKKTFTTKQLKLEARLRTTAQLRTGSAPNPWETAWLIWDYQDNDHFSYLAIKTNGWELGKRDPAYPGGQRFLATGTNLATAVGQWRKVRITRTINSPGRSVLKAFYGSRQLTRFVDTEHPYRAGKIGFYTEDATIDIDTATTTPNPR